MITPPEIGFGKGDSSFKYGYFHVISSIYFEFPGCNGMCLLGFCFVSCLQKREPNLCYHMFNARSFHTIADASGAACPAG